LFSNTNRQHLAAGPAASAFATAKELAGGSSTGGEGGNCGGGRVSRSSSPIPPSKALTAEEAEKLASLYK
jgi:hypothetical protein